MNDKKTDMALSPTSAVKKNEKYFFEFKTEIPIFFMSHKSFIINV